MDHVSLCSWCRNEYYGSGLYHVCPDGLNYSTRAGKSIREMREEHERQDKIISGYRDVGSGPLVKIYDMPWTPYDLELLAGLKIKP